jgi:hypothetical protein
MTHNIGYVRLTPGLSSFNTKNSWTSLPLLILQRYLIYRSSPPNMRETYSALLLLSQGLRYSHDILDLESIISQGDGRYINKSLLPACH